MKQTHRRAGFTLIELVTVVTIIGILAGIAIQQYGKVRLHAQAATLSYALHEMEDVIGQALIRGELYNAGLPITERAAIIAHLPEGDRAALDPELPDGLQLDFIAGTGPSNLTSAEAGAVRGPGTIASSSAKAHPALLITFMDITSDNRHRALLDKLAELRPTTARPAGHVVVAELIDMRDMVLVPAPDATTSNP